MTCRKDRHASCLQRFGFTLRQFSDNRIGYQAEINEWYYKQSRERAKRFWRDSVTNRVDFIYTVVKKEVSVCGVKTTKRMECRERKSLIN